MKKTLTINDIESLVKYIRFEFRGGISELSVAAGITIGKVRDVLEGRTKNSQTITRICEVLQISPKDIKEWKDVE